MSAIKMPLIHKINGGTQSRGSNSTDSELYEITGVLHEIKGDALVQAVVVFFQKIL